MFSYWILFSASKDWIAVTATYISIKSQGFCIDGICKDIAIHKERVNLQRPLVFALVLVQVGLKWTSNNTK